MKIFTACIALLFLSTALWFTIDTFFLMPMRPEATDKDFTNGLLCIGFTMLLGIVFFLFHIIEDRNETISHLRLKLLGHIKYPES